MNDNQTLVALFDKYIKQNDLSLINAYLKHLELNQTQDVTNNETFYFERTQNELIIAQKSYKFVIIIDYSQYSALDLTKLALEKIVEKLESEYDRLLSDVSLKISLTVLFWHPCYTNSKFSILIYEKLLKRSNFHIVLPNLVLDKINQVKKELDESEKTSQPTSFEYLVSILMRLFKPCLLEIVNIIYITDGLFYSVDRSRQLEAINSSGLAFSFVLIGNINGVSYSFGYTTDFVYMKFLASITRGYLATLNDYYEYDAIVDNPLLLIFNKQLSDNLIVDDVIIHLLSNSTLNLTTSTSSTSFTDQDDNEVSTSSSFMDTTTTCVLNSDKRLINLQSLSLAIDTPSNEYEKQDRLSMCSSCKSFEPYSFNSKLNNRRDQYLESKLLSKYDIKCELNEVLSLRAKEGFYLVKICNQNVYLNESNEGNKNKAKIICSKKSLISVYLVKYYSQTSAIIYKAIYNKKYNRKLSIEIYLAWNYLSIKSIYQNSKLLQYLKTTINAIQLVDLNERRSWDLTTDMYKIPIDLPSKIKKPLLKLASKNKFKYEANQNLNLNSLKVKSFIDSWNRYLSCDLIERYLNVFTIEVLLNYIYKPNSQNGLFDTQYAISEFYKVFINWCDLVLVENMIYMKYLNSQTQENFDSLASSPLTTTQNIDAYVILRLNTKHLPYASIRLSFSPNFLNYDCHLVIDSLKNKLETVFSRVLNSSNRKFELIEKTYFDESSKKSNEINCDSLNLMYQRKFLWNLATKLNIDSFKQQIIDLFIKMRLNEGFKCLFQTKQFIVLLNDSFNCESDVDEAATRKKLSIKSPTSVNQLFEMERLKTSKTCSILYTIYFIIEDEPNKIATEISIEQIDGLYQSKNYFKDLNYAQIAKIIYLLDYEAFAVNQTYLSIENYQQESINYIRYYGYSSKNLLNMIIFDMDKANLSQALNEIRLLRTENIIYTFSLNEVLKYSSFICVLYEDTPLKIAPSETNSCLNQIFTENFNDLLKENKLRFNFDTESEDIFKKELKILIKTRISKENLLLNSIDNLSLNYFFKYNGHHQDQLASTSSSSSAFSNTSSLTNVTYLKTLNSPNSSMEITHLNKLYLFIYSFLDSGELVLFLFNCGLNIVRNSMLDSTTRESSYFQKRLFKVHSDDTKYTQLSKYLKVSSDNIEFLFYADLIEKFSSIAYLDSILVLLSSYRKEKLNEDNIFDEEEPLLTTKKSQIELDKEATNKFLDLARKIKLVDVDITDYIKSICSNFNELTNALENQESTLVEQVETFNIENTNFDRKFDEIFSSHLSTLASFTDLYLLDGKTNLSDAITSSPYISQQYSKLLETNTSKCLTNANHLISIEYVLEVNELVSKFGKTQTKTNLFSSIQSFNKHGINNIFDFLSNNEIDLAEISKKRSMLREDEMSSLETRVFLRFNWYFFEDSLSKTPKSPYNQITIHTSSYSPPPPAITSSQPPMMSKFNASLLVSSTSSLSPTAPQQTQNSLLIPTTTINEKNELVQLLEPLIVKFKWYLNEEILQKTTHLNDLNEFDYYVRHIKDGVLNKNLNCRCTSKYVSFNMLLNAIKRNLISPKVTEDCKLMPEFLELVEKLKGQFYQCKLQKLDHMNYFLSCTYLNNDQSANQTLTDDSELSSFKIFIKVLERETMIQPKTPSPHIISPINTILKTENNITIELYFDFNSNYFTNLELIDSLMSQFNDKLDFLINSISLKLILKEIDESRKWNDSLVLSDSYTNEPTLGGSKMNLMCDSVWSQSFKLHRLNQKSAGLTKLKDFLVNLKIDDAPDDIYVFNYKALNEIYLIKIKEIEAPLDEQIDITDELNFSRSLEDQETILTLVTKPSSASSIRAQPPDISRRQSYTSVDEPGKIRAHNTSVGSANVTNITSAPSTSGNPDYIRLTLYGLHEPDEELKQTLCKSLQTELDNCLLYKICYSIEKNTYKTTSSAQSFEEDLIFIKKLSELYFEDEIQLPLVFNLNQKLRENFIFYLRQILNSYFKSIDINLPLIQLQRTPLSQNSNAKRSLLNLVPSSETSSATSSSTELESSVPLTQPLLSQNFSQPTQVTLMQNYSFSFLCPQPSPGPLNELNDYDFSLITRLFNLKIGYLSKNSFSIALVECYYSTTGSGQLVTRKLVKSSDLSMSTSNFQTQSNQLNIQTNVNESQACNGHGPTLYFRFYIRGENDVDLIKGNLRSALNEALLLVVSNYLTKIDVDYYVKQFDANQEILKQGEVEYKDFNEVLNHFRGLDHEVKFDYVPLLDSIILHKANDHDIDFEFDKRKPLTKTYLRIIYNWLRVLHCHQQTNASSSSNSSLSASLSGPSSLSRLNSTSSQPNQFHLSNSIQLVYRKEFTYYSRYNLIGFIRDFENYLRDNLKSQIQKYFYTFTDYNFTEVNYDKLDSFEPYMDIPTHEYHDEFEGLNRIDFSQIEDQLSRKSNVICILNVDFATPSSTKAVSNVPSYNNVTNLAKTPKQSQNLSNLSRTIDDAQSLQLKRLYCLMIVDSKKKSLISYSFITESKHYDLVRSYIDQASDTILYRNNLVNNTIVYKLGGLIGDLICDAKNIRNLLHQDNENKRDMSNFKPQSPTVHRQFIYPTTQQTPQTTFRTCLLNHTQVKVYDQIVNQVNQQISLTHNQQPHQLSSDNNATLLSFMYGSNHTQRRRNSFQKTYPNTSSIYGVGLNYQLLEKHQTYRHPQKVYELALNLAANNSPPASNSSTIIAASPQIQANLSTPNKTQLSVAEFYKNQIVPILNSYCYYVAPTLFFRNWSEVLVTEKMLNSLMSGILSTSSKTSSINNQIDEWYKKMRLHLLNDFSRYFETKGFIRLREDRKSISEAITINSQSGIPIDNSIIHFIKWIPHDGFLFVTLSFEEIYLVAKFGFSTRYRSASRTFFNEIMRFLSNDFNIQRCSYDFHLSVLSRALQSPSQGNQLALSTLIKCLDEFVDYFDEIKNDDNSINKIFKLMYEKQDCSMIPHKVSLIFDFFLNTKQKQDDTQFILTYLNMQSNIAIYSLITNQKVNDYSKHFILKIDSSTRDSLKTSISSSSLLKDAKIGEVAATQSDALVKLIGYYLCISKHYTISSSKQTSELLVNDLNLINQTVEDALSDYKRQIFWDNLSLSLKNEQQTANIVTYLMQNNELEYILENSYKIDACTLDSKLNGLLKKCYLIKDIVQSHFNQSFANHHIFLRMQSIDFSILLVTQNLNCALKLDEDESNDLLNSFILMKFNHLNKTCELYQINRVQKEQENKRIKNLEFIINTLVYLVWKSLYKC